MLFLGPFLQRLAEGAPPSILAGGGHVDWLESFAYEPIRSVQDVAPRSLVASVGSPVVKPRPREARSKMREDEPEPRVGSELHRTR